MANLELQFLGGFSLLQDGLPLPELKSQKGQALVCYLAVTRKPAPRAALAGLFWPDMPEADAHMNLRKVLVRLKPVSAYLGITRAALTFNLEASHTVDVTEFEAAAGIKDDIGRLQLAVELFQGDFLDGFYLPDAPFFEEWALAQRTRLRAMALAALGILVDHFAGRGAYEPAVDYARRRLAFEPWHEETHRELMRLLALNGQRGAALVQFETCRGVLAGELGVEPAPATIQLYEQIKSGAADAPQHNLPVQPTAFVGREAELAALAANLADPTARLVTILGLGGMGKTRLALAAAAAQLNGPAPGRLFSHGVIFVSLARLETPDQLVPAIAEAVNLRFQSGSDPKTQLLDFLRHKALLLVLDNFEHLRAQASLMDEILRAAPRLKIMVTSREKLNLQAEQLFPIGGLQLPAPDQAADGPAHRPLSQYSAIQLFCERARRVRPDFALTAENQAAVVDICRLVQGMPLGIILAAVWLETFAPDDIAAEIRANLDFLAGEMADMPVRQRSLRAAFSHTWRLLPAAERAAFQRLSIFRGGFTRPAAQSVTGASWRDLQGLVDKSLLTVSPKGRYDVHELLRQFAAETLTEAPEIEAAMRDHHSAYYCNFLYAHTEHWHTGRQLDTLAAVTSEADNVQRAWQWAVDRQDYRRLLMAVDSWAWYHGWRGRFAEAEAVFRALSQCVSGLAARATVVAPEIYRLWAKALAWQGAYTLYSLSGAQVVRDGLDVIERPELAGLDTRRDKAFLLNIMADRYGETDRLKCRYFREQSLALFQACNDQWGIAIELGGLAHLDWATGHYAPAEEKARASLEMHRARGDLREQIWVIIDLAWISLHRGNLDEAIRLRRQALELSQQLGDPSALVGCMAHLAQTLQWQGRFEEMRFWGEQSLALCLEIGDRGFEGYVRLVVCVALLYTGQYEPARRECTLALARARESGNVGVEAALQWPLGYVALNHQAYEAARSAFAECRRLLEPLQDNYLMLALPGPGFVACCEGRPALARQHFLEALQFALRLKDYVALIMALPGVALFLGLTGETVRAVEIWALALSLPYIANSQWYDDIVGRPLAAVAAALSPDEREAARGRGRALDLWQTAQALAGELQRDGVAVPLPAWVPAAGS